MSSALVRAGGAWAALCRDAANWEACQTRNREFKVKSKTQVEYLPYIPSEIREEYAHELLEVSGRYMDVGHTEQEADRLAIDDLGCVEFWGFMRERELVLV